MFHFKINLNEIQKYNSDNMVGAALLSQLRLTFLAYNRVFVTQDWAGGGIKAQTDPFSRLFYLNSGEGRLIFSDSEVIMVPGPVYSIPSFEPCRYVCSKDMDLSFIHYQAHVQGGIDFFSLFKLSHITEMTDTMNGHELFNVLVEKGRSVSDTLRREGVIRLILGNLARDLSEWNLRDFSGLNRFEPVFSYVEDNLESSLGLEELSSLISLHPTYFSNLFTRTLGMTLSQYIRKKRVDRAALMLAYGEDKLEAIAAQTGFSDACHLSRVFKELTGYPPSLFRKRVRGLS